ncbi:MAG: PorV/PorQ family protein [Thermoplasmata archaeon]
MFKGVVCYSNDSGVYSGESLKLSVGSRNIALGESGVASSNDFSSFYWNPALIANNYNLIGFEYSKMVADIKSLFIGLNIGIGDNYFCGLGVRNVSLGDVLGTDEFGNFVGKKYFPRDVHVYIAFAKKYNSFLNIGMNLKYINSKLITEAETLTFDLGVYNKLYDNMDVGFNLQNITGSLKYVKTKDKLPLNLKVGFSYYPVSNIIFSGDFNIPRDNITWFGGGLEFRLSNVLSLRIGYNEVLKRLNGFRNFNFGFGLRKDNLHLDYSIIFIGDLGGRNIFSLTKKFGN